mmetsp:Transcript_30603/g.46192  ORF Transcript_30603/g.46192 Transcript_30603/m.46192 type:complete len:138 (-) Transcript_30603:65-478(-)
MLHRQVRIRLRLFQRFRESCWESATTLFTQPVQPGQAKRWEDQTGSQSQSSKSKSIGAEVERRPPLFPTSFEKKTFCEPLLLMLPLPAPVGKFVAGSAANDNAMAAFRSSSSSSSWVVSGFEAVAFEAGAASIGDED